MHLFAFLGTGRYSACRYELENSESPWVSPSVRYIQTAVALSLGDELGAVTIFATSQAQETHSASLKAEFADFGLEIPLQFVDVPTGMNSNEMFELFEILNDKIGDSPRVVFDITHGFRSQPLMGLMILNYLRATRPQLIIEDIVYGAFDLNDYRQNDESPELTYPIVSLKPLWELNEWAAAFRTFQQTGDARALTDKANQTHNSHVKKRLGQDGPIEGRFPKLKTYANTLSKWQRQMDLCAIPSLFDEQGKGVTSGYLHQISTEDWDELSDTVGRFMRPLRTMVAETVEPMIADDWFSIDGLEAQLKILEWLKEHGRHQPFLTIAREWLGLLIALAIGKPAQAGDSLVGLMAAYASRQYDPKKDSKGDRIELARRISEIFGDDIKIASDITNTRNGVNHCWIGHSEPSTKVIEKVLDTYPSLLDALRLLAS